MVALFWISFSVLFYTYLGYGLLLFVLTSFSRRKAATFSGHYPEVTFVVAAYNEDAVIERKIQNSLALQYPPGKLFFLVVTDGSTDRTNEILSQYSQLTVLKGERRLGKTAAINKAMKAVRTPIVVFSDANTLLHEDCLMKLVPHYADPTVGGVAGEKRIQDKEASTVGFGERLYWQYESLLKKADARFYTVIGAAGELFSIRTALFQPVNESVILDDFVISANVCRQGYRVVYEADAFAVETSSASITEERKRKVRISAGCFQAMVHLKTLLNPFAHFRLFFQYLSHRVFRWTLCPLCLPLFFVTNAYLALSTHLVFFYTVIGAQVLFYLLALLGALAVRQTKLPKLLLVPYYFVFMNLSLYKGFYLFLTGKQTAVWRKAVRKPLFH